MQRAGPGFAPQVVFMRHRLAHNAGHRLFVLLGTITIVLATAVAVGVIQFRAYSRVFAGSHEVLNAITVLEASTARVETSARAYVLTGEDSFYRDFQVSQAAARHDRDALDDLIAPADIEQPNIDRLSEVLKERWDQLTQAVELRKSTRAVPNGLNHADGERAANDI